MRQGFYQLAILTGLICLLYSCGELIRLILRFMDSTHKPEWRQSWFMLHPYWWYWAEIGLISIGIIGALYGAYRIWPKKQRKLI